MSGPMASPVTHETKAPVTLSELEVEAFLARYPGLKRLEILAAIVQAGPDRNKVDAAVARLWSDQVLASGPSII
jgi:hypothetical protein